MTSTGYTNCANQGTNVLAGSSYTWSNITFVQTLDSNRATLLIAAAGYSQYVTATNFATNFGFAIPSNATIDGIQVEIAQNYTGTKTQARDQSVKLIKSDGTLGTADKATGTQYNITADVYQYYGGATDLWSDAWTPADINNANFGVAYAAYGQYCFPAGTMIRTPDGEVPIELLKKDDVVLAFKDDGSVVSVRVNALAVADAPALVHIVAEDYEVFASEKHPFWNGKDYVTADSIIAGDTVFVLEGSVVPKTVTSTETIVGDVTVYGLSVRCPHTYFANGFAVHNKQQLTIGCNHIAINIYYTLKLGIKLSTGPIKLSGGPISLVTQ